MRYLKAFLTILYIFSVYSCEYEPPEKFTELYPEGSPPVLNLQPLELNKDTLYIWCKTKFNFNLTSIGPDIIAVIINSLGKTDTIVNPNGYFTIDPTGIQDGTYKVQMNIFTHSGTGSLADAIGSEGFLFAKEWTLIIERPANIKVSFLGPFIEKGFLKIQWQKFNRPYFHSYKIYVNDSCLNHTFSRTIYNTDSTYIIDSSFVGGKVQFRLLISLINENGIPNEVEVDKMTYRYPVTVTFDERSDSMTINWTNIPFNHTIYLYSTLLNLGNAKSYTIRSPGLGYETSYQLSIKPVVKLTWDHQMYYIYNTYTTGNKTEMKFSRMVYIPENNAFYLKHPMFLRKFNGATLLRLLNYNYAWDYYDNSTIAFSSDKSQIFTTVNQDIIRLNNSTFEVIDKKKFGPSSSGSKYLEMMHVLNDSIMFISGNINNSNIWIYNYIKSEVIDSTGLLNSDGSPYNLTISNDGKYVANCGNGLLRIFKNNDNSGLEKIYEASGNFLECIFDPVNVSNLLIVTSESSYILHCPDMVLVSGIPATVKGMAVNFDPVTNNLLFVSQVHKTITVYDYEHNTIKFKCNHHGYFLEFYLANNVIFHTGGYNLSIN